MAKTLSGGANALDTESIREGNYATETAISSMGKTLAWMEKFGKFVTLWTPF
jgi:hypothetical protein